MAAHAGEDALAHKLVRHLDLARLHAGRVRMLEIDGNDAHLFVVAAKAQGVDLIRLDCRACGGLPGKRLHAEDEGAFGVVHAVAFLAVDVVTGGECGRSERQDESCGEAPCQCPFHGFPPVCCARSPLRAGFPPLTGTYRRNTRFHKAVQAGKGFLSVEFGRMKGISAGPTGGLRTSLSLPNREPGRVQAHELRAWTRRKMRKEGAFRSGWRPRRARSILSGARPYNEECVP